MRDEAQSERDGKRNLLNRRDYLAAAGVAGLSAIVGVGSASAQTEEYDEALLIDATGSDATCTYTIDCQGTVERVRTLASVDDTVEDGLIEGTITEGVAAYKLTGEVTAFAMDGTATLEYGSEVVSELPEPLHTIEIESPDALEYEFTTTGEASKLQDRGTMSAEETNDEIVHHDDGTCTVSGFTGNLGYGDAYAYEGEITDFSPYDTDIILRVDGQETTIEELTGQSPTTETNTVCITTPNSVEYEFTTSGAATKVTDAGSMSAEETNDEIVHNGDGTCTVSGFTGNAGYGDTYEYEGEITDFSPLRTDVTVEVNGEGMTPYELLGEEPPEENSTVSEAVIGGGQGYEDTVSPSEATVTVSSLSGLRSALDDASSGDVVYVDGDASIDMGTAEMTVPRGVTLASDRGINGSEGAHLQSDDRPWGMFTVYDDARVTGIRIGGPRWDFIENIHGGEMAIDVVGSDVVIDNCELYGWGYASIRTEDDTHIHHNHIHHNPKDGTGYGVSTGSSENPIIEYNRFDHNRHSVASSSNGYTARYNYVGKGAISHVFDQHRPGGSTIKIHHNTVEVVDNSFKNKNVPAVAIRGTPSDVADIHHNWFHNPKEPEARATGSWTDEAIIQVHVNDWENVDFHNNHYGSDEPSADVGHPR